MGETGKRKWLRNMKVGMLSWESLHSIKVGGLALAVTGMAEGLAENGHEVHIFTRAEDGQSEHDKINGVHYHRCKFDSEGGILEHTRKMCNAFAERVREVENNTGRFDVIHGHDWMVADALEKLQDRPTVMSFNSTEHGRTNGSESGKKAEKEWLGGYVSDKVLTVSETMKSELVDLYQIPADKIHVVPNGTLTQDLEEEVDPGEIKDGYGIPPLTPVVPFLGRLAYQKGPDILLDAIPQVLDYRSEVEFLVAGDGEMRDYLESKAGRMGVSHSTSFLGYVSEEEKIDLLNASDLVCMPSRNEPFGLVLFEAWAAGTAVVASNVGGLGENVDNFVNGIKTKPIPEAIGWGVNFALEDPEQVQRMGRKGKSKLDEYRWDRIGRELRIIYEEAQN